ncbi:potassium-transporting ATPase subunit C [Actinomadura sp. HBU206391]|uniref:potassium-transporting ATPase subunit C n=1 Tax=Actinomadura sp. HBU206391 TaxID=2731692 RepID=UPI00165056BE|nr:potassium-transporting ATPase subunit C [Actinomadura sp. HBU206391]MBC6459736.1 potassium-transporting ATPase subunit C [Actinomadura sp. HBU206391]
MRSSWLRSHLAALRALLVLTVLTGVLYPLAIWAVAQLPGLHDKADGSLIKAANGSTVGSRIIGQSFTDKDGNPLKQYFQSRPSTAGDGYDPTATAASNLGPESIVDTLPVPGAKDDEGNPDEGDQSLLTQVCTRSKDIGELEGVDGSRPFCAKSGVGAVLSVFGSRDAKGVVTRPTRVVSVNEACPAAPFITAYRGVAVECAKPGEDYAEGQIVPIRGGAPAKPEVPSDAVTASGSGLDPAISTAYARLQAPRVATARGIAEDKVLDLIDKYTTGRSLGFMGEPSVNVVELNLDLDRAAPYKS